MSLSALFLLSSCNSNFQNVHLSVKFFGIMVFEMDDVIQQTISSFSDLLNRLFLRRDINNSFRLFELFNFKLIDIFFEIFQIDSLWVRYNIDMG